MTASTDAGRRVPCVLCGYRILDDFYVRVPTEVAGYAHTLSCGPTPGGDLVAKPTHRRLADGSFQRIDVWT